jgi:hypothetical protein
VSSGGLRWSRWTDAELRAEDERASELATAEAGSNPPVLPSGEAEVYGGVAGKPYLRAPSEVATGTAERARSEHFRELAKRSHEARRRKKDPKERIKEAMRRQIEQNPDEVVAALMRSPKGLEQLLAHGAELFAQEPKQPTLIVLQSAWPDDSYKRTHGRWLRLLREQNLAQLEAELKVHAK